jgi:hypothetical protein
VAKRDSAEAGGVSTSGHASSDQGGDDNNEPLVLSIAGFGVLEDPELSSCLDELVRKYPIVADELLCAFGKHPIPTTNVVGRFSKQNTQ